MSITKHNWCQVTDAMLLFDQQMAQGCPSGFHALSSALILSYQRPFRSLFGLSWLFLRNKTHCQTLHRLVTVAEIHVFSILHCHHLQSFSLCLNRTNLSIYLPWETFVLKCLTIWIKVKTAQLNQPIRSRSKYSRHTHLKKNMLNKCCKYSHQTFMQVNGFRFWVYVFFFIMEWLKLDAITDLYKLYRSVLAMHWERGSI